MWVFIQNFVIVMTEHTLPQTIIVGMIVTGYVVVPPIIMACTMAPTATGATMTYYVAGYVLIASHHTTTTTHLATTHLVVVIAPGVTPVVPLIVNLMVMLKSYW